MPATVALNELSFDSRATAVADAAGLSTAVEKEGMSLSLAIDPWQTTPVQVAVTWRGGQNEMMEIENLWSDHIGSRHVSILRQRVAVLPIYDDPGHHDPERPEYDPRKSHIPRHAKRILSHALPVDTSRTTWWARCEHGFFHRYQGSPGPIDVVVHWNGTTNPEATQPSAESDVPHPLRVRLSRGELARGCGCREV